MLTNNNSSNEFSLDKNRLSGLTFPYKERRTKQAKGTLNPLQISHITDAQKEALQRGIKKQKDLL